MFEFGVYNGDRGDFEICAWPAESLSIPTAKAFAAFKFYPNLVENSIQIESPFEMLSLTINDITGKQPLEVQPQTTSYSLKIVRLSKGVFTRSRHKRTT
ncbi:MAG: Uncharacterised protein [Bacteroidetes bacterium MED-G17]|nr:MAG: Uncharacterised protein [Bacteroidetes bacterium MED-G17]